MVKKDLFLGSRSILFRDCLNKIENLAYSLDLDKDKKSDLKSKLKLLRKISLIQSEVEPTMTEEYELLLLILYSYKSTSLESVIDEVLENSQSNVNKEERILFVHIIKQKIESLLILERDLDKLLKKKLFERSENSIVPNAKKIVPVVAKTPDSQTIYEDVSCVEPKRSSSEVVYLTAANKDKKIGSKPFFSVKDRIRTFVQKGKSFCVCDPKFLQGSEDLPKNIKRIKSKYSVKTLLKLIQEQIDFVQVKPDVLVDEDVNLVKIMFGNKKLKHQKKEATCIRRIA